MSTSTEEKPIPNEIRFSILPEHRMQRGYTPPAPRDMTLPELGEGLSFMQEFVKALEAKYGRN